MKKWLDKYNDGGPVQPNYNDAKASTGPGYVGSGYDTTGRNYSPAWGGQFQNGGKAKSHKPTVKEISQMPDRPIRTDSNLENVLEIVDPYGITSWDDIYRSARDYGVFSKETATDVLGAIPMLGKLGKVGKVAELASKAFAVTGRQKRNAKAVAETLKAVGKYGPGAARATDAKQAYDERNNEYAMGGGIPGAVGFTYARTVGAAPANGKYTKKTKASAQNGKEMSFYQQGLDWKPNNISRDGSVIKDDMGQWAHPGEITQINSNNITMQGVDYPVLGVSDTGDTKMMQPGEDYKFDGEKVTEYPIAQDGILTTLGGIANKIKKGISNLGVKEYDNKKSFDDAYSTARKEGQAEFVFKGNKYSTKYKGTPEEQLNETGITDAQLQKRNIIQDNLAKNLVPFGYDNVRAIGALFGKDKDRQKMEDAAANNKDLNSIYTAEQLRRRLDATNLYSGYPQKYGTFSVSKHKPAISKNKDDIYYSVTNKELLDNLKDNLEYDQSWNDKSKKYEFTNARFNKDVLKNRGASGVKNKYVSGDVTGVMGNYTTSLGRDDKGEYISYYDKWDLDPIDFGKPMEIYDKVYLKDLLGGYKDTPKKENGGWLNKYK